MRAYYINAAYCSHLSCVRSGNYDPTCHQRRSERRGERGRTWGREIKPSLRVTIRGRQEVMEAQTSGEVEEEGRWCEGDVRWRDGRGRKQISYPPRLFAVINSRPDIRIWISSTVQMSYYYSLSSSSFSQNFFEVWAAHSGKRFIHHLSLYIELNF